MSDGGFQVVVTPPSRSGSEALLQPTPTSAPSAFQVVVTPPRSGPETFAQPTPTSAPKRKVSHSRAKSVDVADLPREKDLHLHVPAEKGDSRRPSLDMVRRGVERLEGRTREIRNRASFEISRLPSLRILEGETHDKRVHWGELFGDLMYIIAVQALSDRFAHDPSLLNAAAFLGLYLAVYWSWCGEVMYLDRFETNDLLHRVALFVEMVGVMFMVVALTGSNDQLSLLFPISYIIVRMLFVILYGRIAIWMRKARKLALTHSLMLLAAVMVWLGAIFVPRPWNFILWGVALLIDLSIPVVTYNMEKKLPLNTSHMGERLGLFIIIDLGEMVLATVRGLGEHVETRTAILSILYGVAIAYSCWWLYFDEAGFSIGKRPKILKHALQRFNWIGKFWFYIHFFLNVSLTTVGVGLELIVHHVAKKGFDYHAPVAARWILAAGLITFLAALGGVHLSHHGLEVKQKLAKAVFRIGGAVIAAVVVAAAGPHIPAWLFVLLFLLINVSQILFDLLFHEPWVVRAADRRKALSKAMQEKLKEQAEAAPSARGADEGRRSLDEPRIHREASRFSLDIPRRPAEV